MEIKMALQPNLYDETTVIEFAQLCEKNNIHLYTHIRKNEIQHCALDQVIQIVISPDMLNLLFNFISSGLYDLFKAYVINLIKGTQTSKKINSMKIIFESSQFIVESKDLSESTIEKGLDTFREIVLAKNDAALSPREKMLNTTIVFPNAQTGEIEVQSELDFIKKHIVQNANHMEVKENG